MNNQDHFANWTECFNSFKLLSQNVQQIIRNGASDELVRNGAEEVGSSDTNHSIYSAWRRNGRDWNAVVINYFEEFIAARN